MVFWAILLQVVFGVVVLKTDFGQMALKELAGAVTALIGYADFGGEFVFGHLSRDPTPYIFAFRVLHIVIFISSLFTCLYYLGIMQLIVVAMAKIMKRFLGVSGAESLSMAANVFMGQYGGSTRHRSLYSQHDPFRADGIDDRRHGHRVGCDSGCLHWLRDQG